MKVEGRSVRTPRNAFWGSSSGDPFFTSNVRTMLCPGQRGGQELVGLQRDFLSMGKLSGWFGFFANGMPGSSSLRPASHIDCSLARLADPDLPGKGR